MGPGWISESAVIGRTGMLTILVDTIKLCGMWIKFVAVLLVINLYCEEELQESTERQSRRVRRLNQRNTNNAQSSSSTTSSSSTDSSSSGTGSTESTSANHPAQTRTTTNNSNNGNQTSFLVSNQLLHDYVTARLQQHSNPSTFTIVTTSGTSNQTENNNNTESQSTTTTIDNNQIQQPIIERNQSASFNEELSRIARASLDSEPELDETLYPQQHQDLGSDMEVTDNMNVDGDLLRDDIDFVGALLAFTSLFRFGL